MYRFKTSPPRSDTQLAAPRKFLTRVLPNSLKRHGVSPTPGVSIGISVALHNRGGGTCIWEGSFMRAAPRAESNHELRPVWRSLGIQKSVIGKSCCSTLDRGQGSRSLRGQSGKVLSINAGCTEGRTHIQKGYSGPRLKEKPRGCAPDDPSFPDVSSSQISTPSPGVAATIARNGFPRQAFTCLRGRGVPIAQSGETVEPHRSTYDRSSRQ